MKYTGADHTFVVCAYKKSPYLKKCIESLLKQNVKSNRIIVATSTPNEYIEEVAKQYELELFVNGNPPGIATDWNFGYSKATTELVTIAHQDDIYDTNYLELILVALNKKKDPILAHSTYYEIRAGKKVFSNTLLRIKRLLLLPVVPSFTWNSKFLRRLSLSFGCGICCPSVTFVRKRLPKEPFSVGNKASLDWEAWEKYSKLKGAFCYVTKPVMGHRVHEDSETSNVIGEGDGRTPEDYSMFRKFWPKCIADILIKFYSKGQNSNKL
ncbi:MAG: glycosyltransferase family 2 protein [Lachnospiraceae bacterium]|nr:glycosyltransferase family 2 protein [Lachnospiraceae bacterium]